MLRLESPHRSANRKEEKKSLSREDPGFYEHRGSPAHATARRQSSTSTLLHTRSGTCGALHDSSALRMARPCLCLPAQTLMKLWPVLGLSLGRAQVTVWVSRQLQASVTGLCLVYSWRSDGGRASVKRAPVFLSVPTRQKRYTTELEVPGTGKTRIGQRQSISVQDTRSPRGEGEKNTDRHAGTMMCIPTLYKP